MEPPPVEPLIEHEERTAFIIENSLQPSQTCSIKNMPPHIFLSLQWLTMHEVEITITDYLHERIPAPSLQSRIAVRITISTPHRSDTDPLLTYHDLDRVQSGIMHIISSRLANTSVISVHIMQQRSPKADLYSIVLSVTIIKP